MTPARILIVEDDRIVARDLAQQLARLGHTVVGTTGRGEDVLALALETKPTLVLMDVRLEGRADGIDAAEQLREAMSVPVIFLTAYADDPTVERASRTEPFGYLTKPFDESQLRTTIELALTKHAAEQRRRDAARLELALRGSDIGVWEFELVNGRIEEARVVSVNFWQRHGYPSEVGVTFPMVVDRWHPDDRARVLAAIQACLSGATPQYEIECRIREANGAYRWRLVRGVVVRDANGVATRFVGSSIDITSRYELEAQLQSAKELAEASNRAKDEFLANVSHEIRTPMNAILGMTELVLDTSLAESQRQSLRTVKSAATSLLAIINDLLDFSKMEAGKIELDPSELHLRALLGDTMRALAVRAHRKGLELLCSIAPDAPDLLVGDAGRLRQILINLVGNAIKFTPRGEVQVDVTCEAIDGDRVELRFSVRDTGIGIPDDKQLSIFRAFEQEDMSTTRRYGGTGLGLTIASRFVEMMGGTLSVSSTPGRGSTFVFGAFFGWRQENGLARAVPPRADLGPLRVLVVDDNAANRDILEQWLASWRMEATTARDAMTAMDALWHGVSSRRPYALVLLDARMPHTDGLELAATIRERAELASTRIILLTSGDRPGDAERLRALRIDAHVLKPVPQDELFETIHDVMTRSEQGPPSILPAASVRTAAESASAGTLPLRILVAEDNPFNAQLLQQLLTSRGHAVRVAADGREALEYARSGGFDLLLLDLHMPELDGFQVIAELREHERTTGKHLRTIALTARSRAEDRARCFAAGMDDFLAKPIQAAALWAMIEPGTASASLTPSSGPILDAAVLLAACGGDAAVLAAVRAGLAGRLPEDLVRLERALRDHDAARLREVAHAASGMLAAFSTMMGGLASTLEDVAAAGDLEAAGDLLERLRALSPELLAAADAATIASLTASAEVAQGVPA